MLFPPELAKPFAAIAEKVLSGVLLAWNSRRASPIERERVHGFGLSEARDSRLPRGMADTSEVHTTSPRQDQSPVVVCAADDRFAMPLAVMGRSLLDRLPPGVEVTLYVIDGGIRARNKGRVLASWEDHLRSTQTPPRLRVEWLRPAPARLERMKVSGHVAMPTYYRLLIADLLPPEISKALYLDCDIVVESSIADVWRTDVSRYALAAVQDMIVPTVSAPWGLGDYRELGLPADGKYFNAGVMLLNLERWRRERIAEAVIDYVDRNHQRIRFWDQDGLNAVLAGKWLELPLSWNLTILTRDFPPLDQVPCGREEYEELIRAPRITHFLSSTKPWHAGCEHPRRDAFFAALDRTAWAGWRPSAARELWQRIKRAPERLGIRR